LWLIYLQSFVSVLLAAVTAYPGAQPIENKAPYAPLGTQFYLGKRSVDDGLTVNAQEGNNKVDSGANQNYRGYNVHNGVDEMTKDSYNPYAYGYYPLRMRSTSYANNGADGNLYYGRQILGYGGLGYGYPFSHLGKRSADGDPNAQAEPDTTNQILNLMPELKTLQTQELTP